MTCVILIALNFVFADIAIIVNIPFQKSLSNCLGHRSSCLQHSRRSLTVHPGTITYGWTPATIKCKIASLFKPDSENSEKNYVLRNLLHGNICLV